MKFISFVLQLIFLFTVKNLYGQFVVTYTFHNNGNNVTATSGNAGGGIMSSEFVPVTPQVLQGISNKILLAINKTELNLGEFDKNSSAILRTVNQMQLDSGKAAKYPKAMEYFNKAISKYKSIEPLSKKINDTWNQRGGKDIASVWGETQTDLNQQKNIMVDANRNYSLGEAIIQFGENRFQIISNTESEFVKHNVLNEADKKQLAENKSRIQFAQGQIIKLSNNRQDLIIKTEAVRSDILQNVDVVAIALKSTAKILESYLSVISGNKVFSSVLDVSQTFFEKMIEEKVANGKSYETSIREAFGAAYLKALIATSSLEKFPLDDFLVLPSKVKDIADDAKSMNELIEVTTKTRNQINEQLKLVDKVIAINKKIIEDSNRKTKEILLRESKTFITK